MGYGPAPAHELVVGCRAVAITDDGIVWRERIGVESVEIYAERDDSLFMPSCAMQAIERGQQNRLKILRVICELGPVCAFDIAFAAEISSHSVVERWNARLRADGLIQIAETRKRQNRYASRPTRYYTITAKGAAYLARLKDKPQ